VDVVEREIAAIVAEVAEIDADEIVPQGTLADIGVDSLMAVEIAVDVERRFGIQFDEVELKRVASFRSLVELARAKLPLAREG
jgi:acyl carrier protein